MPSPSETITTISTKGQLILPKAIRQHQRFQARTRLIVEETEDGVRLRQAPVFPLTRPDDVFASLAYKGPPKSLDEMDLGVLAEAKRRHARD